MRAALKRHAEAVVGSLALLVLLGTYAWVSYNDGPKETSQTMRAYNGTEGSK